MIFDTHSHYIDSRFDSDREELLNNMKNNGVSKIIEVSARFDEIEKTISLTEKYDFIYGAVGVHPDEVLELNEDSITRMEEYINHPKIVAVGEIGLDYYGDDSVDKTIQERWFRLQIDLARKTKKPIIVHSRDACKDTFKIMTSEHCENIGGVVHCFSYSAEMALKYIEMGFFIGVGGVVTFKNGKKLKEVVSSIPIEKIVLETDCPYLAPMPHRGERNDSTYIKFVANEVATLKGISVEEVINITNANAKRLYNL